jgi:CBS-domain-containing membrane protein
VTLPRVREVMTRTVRTVRQGAGYAEMLEALASQGAGTLPVVDPAGRLLGVVSDGDLLSAVARSGGIPAPPDLPTGSRAAATIAPDASVDAAARLMDATRIERLPVVTAAGTLVGTVSRLQVLQASAPPDPVRRDELAGPVLRRVLARRAPQVRAELTGGVVTLSGSTDRRSTAQLVLGLARDVPGVVDVVDRLTYATDDTRPGPRAPRTPRWGAPSGSTAR